MSAVVGTPGGSPGVRFRLLLAVAGCCALPALAADADPVVARRGTASVSLAEVDARLDEVPPDKRAGFIDNPERVDTTLSQLLLLEQLANEASAAGLDKDPRVAGQMELAHKRILSQLRVEQLREQALAGVDLEALAHERYLADSKAFTIPETRTARHVLFGIDERGEAKAEADAKAAAERLAAGESLEALAKELSDDSGTRQNGGLLSDIPLGRTDPAFEAALFALDSKAPRTTAPVKSKFGWHLIELVSVQPARKQSFDEVHARLISEVSAVATDRFVRNHVDQLQSLPLDADVDAVAGLRTRYANAPAPAAPTAAPPAGSQRP